MLKPNDYDTTTAGGGYTPLPAGGYVCKIMSVEETTVPATATRAPVPLFVVSLDIAEGEHAGRYATEYRNDSRQIKKWGCVLRQNIYKNDGSTNPFFKGLIDAIEKSNGTPVNWCDGQAFTDQFKGRMVGMIFGREQYKNQNGELKWVTRPTIAVPVDRIRSGDFTIPEDKPYIDNSAPIYGAPMQSGIDKYLNTSPQASLSAADDLPF